MDRTLVRWLRGYVRLHAAGCSAERFLNLCSWHGICIWGLTPVRGGYEMCMSLRDFRRIRPLVRKTHTKVLVAGRRGAPFAWSRYRKCRAFLAGVLLFAALLKGCSLFIWDIRIEGNERRTDEALCAYLRSEGVAAPMLRGSVDCPGIVKSIRKEYNDIVWVSASVEGSRLRIQIKENEDTFPGETAAQPQTSRPTDLVASCDGVITSIVTRAGVPQVHAGDRVEKGDILVLGRVDVTDDSGEVTGYQYQKADADIRADTTLEYADEIALTCEEKTYDGKKKCQPYLRIGDVTFSVGTVRNDYARSESSSWERQVRAGENVTLPVAFGVKQVRSYSVSEKTRTEEGIREELSGNFSRFCRELKEKGIQIRENNVKIHLYADSAKASGILFLNRDIAEEADTEILTVERKETDEPVGTDD